MQQFSGEHIAALVVLAAGVVAAVFGPRRCRGKWAVGAMRSLALAIFFAYVAEYVANIVEGTWSIRFNLPLHLTDAVTVVAIAALWSPRPLLVEVVYFWALTASLQAVVTPDLGQPFPSIFYFTYFATHVGAVVAACLLTLGLRLTPRAGAVPRVYAITAAFAALVGLVDLITGANYMYLRRKPERSSLLNVMGGWPWYILAGAAFGLAVFTALAALARLARVRDSYATRRPGVESSTTRRVLIVAYRTAATPLLLDAVRSRAARPPVSFTLLVPRPYWDPDTEEAALTLELALPLLDHAAGDHVDGVVGDPDPFVAVKDVLTCERFDEVIVSTLPARVSHWLRRDLPARLEPLGLPVTVVTAKESTRGPIAG